jgi:hypothetical protein
VLLPLNRNLKTVIFQVQTLIARQGAKIVAYQRYARFFATQDYDKKTAKAAAGGYERGLLYQGGTSSSKQRSELKGARQYRQIETSVRPVGNNFALLHVTVATAGAWNARCAQTRVAFAIRAFAMRIGAFVFLHLSHLLETSLAEFEFTKKKKKKVQ